MTSQKFKQTEIGKILDLMGDKRWYKPIEKGFMTRKFKSKKEAFTVLCKNLRIKPTEKIINALIKSYGLGHGRAFPDTIPMFEKLKGKSFVSMEDLLDKTNSVYKLVILASKRALELNDGSPKLVETENKKISTIALEEIKCGKISMKEKNK